MAGVSGQVPSVIGWPSSLALLRHGESVGNVANARAYATQAPTLDLAVNDPSVELTDLGVAQARAVGTRIGAAPSEEQPQLVLASPYVRARQTAEHLLDAAGLDLPVALDERLRDREQGVLDRLTRWGVAERYPEEAERRDYLGKFWYRPPGGESWSDVAARIRAALLDLRLGYADTRVLVVTHDVPILMTRFVLERLAPEEVVACSGQVRNCALTTYRLDQGRLTLTAFNDATPVEQDPHARVTAHE